MKIVKLSPRENCKFHFGYLSLEINDGIFHSDSLFSTICTNYIREYGEERLDEFIRNFPKITSLFYGIEKNNKTIFFIPKSSIFIKSEKNEEKKKIKKIKFISLGVYKKFISDDLNSDEYSFNEKGNLMYLKTEYDKEDLVLFEGVEDQKVAIDRLKLTSSEGNLYTISSILLHPNTFFYFLIGSDKINEKLEESIKLIERFGIGGEICVGYGQIGKVKLKDLEKYKEFDFLTKESTYWTNLSIVFPSKKELNEVVAYYLLERKGWIYSSSTRRKPLIGLKEGSIFKNKIEGTMVDVSPPERLSDFEEKKSFKFGKAFLIPFKNKL